MALDIDAYNATFKAFADFAKTQMDSGNEKTVARTGTGSAAGLAGRSITAATTDRALGAPLGTGLLPFGDGFNADEISGPDILDDLMN